MTPLAIYVASIVQRNDQPGVPLAVSTLLNTDSYPLYIERVCVYNSNVNVTATAGDRWVFDLCLMTNARPEGRVTACDGVFDRPVGGNLYRDTEFDSDTLTVFRRMMLAADRIALANSFMAQWGNFPENQWIYKSQPDMQPLTLRMDEALVTRVTASAGNANTDNPLTFDLAYYVRADTRNWFAPTRVRPQLHIGM